MRELGGSLAATAVDPGANLLVSGPPMTGKESLAYEILTTGSRAGEGTIIVTTEDTAEDVRKEYRDYDIPEGSLAGVVDCVTRQQGGEDPDGGKFVRHASSPADLTGIGIELSELFEMFYQQEDTEHNRVLLNSVSTLLMYADLQTVFRFLHVFTGRVQSADSIGLFIIDSTTHDQQTLSTLKQLFDGIIQFEETGGSRRCRLTGLNDVEVEWAEPGC